MDSVLIEVALGLALIYLVLSLTVTSLNEAIQIRLDTRGNNLMERLKNLYSPSEHKRIMKDPLIKGLSKSGTPSYIPSKVIGEVVAKGKGFQQLIDKVSSLNKKLEKGKTTYQQRKTEIEQTIAALDIPNEAYVMSIIERTENHGQALVSDIEARIASHYDDAMDRLSGLYAKHMKKVTLIISTLVVLAVNADTINIMTTLMANDALRKSFADSATELVQSEIEGRIKPEANSQTDISANKVAEIVEGERQKILEGVATRLPVGWQCSVDQEMRNKSANFFCNTTLERTSILIKQIFGWLISILAVSLGAPFWFGMLQRLVNIRAVGVKPKRSDEDTPTPNKHTM